MNERHENYEDLAAFSGPPRCEARDLFASERFPNLVTGTDGRILATWGATRLVSRVSDDGGETWQDECTIGPGINGGGTTVDETTGAVFAFVHPEHPPKDGRFAPRTVYRSDDGGATWQDVQAEFLPDPKDNVPALAFAEHGITLRHGPRAGRLIRPARVYGKADGYNTAVYSDDGGRTWRPSRPFPVTGTGEGCIAERIDGTLYYSSRKHFFTEDQTRRSERLSAVSHDGGHTWVQPAYHRNLPDGPRYRGEERRAACWNGHFGMAGGLARLPLDGRDVFIYSNADQPGHTRHRMTLWASFDGGATWPVKRPIDDGPAAYSSLTAGQPGTPSEGWIYLLLERWRDRPGDVSSDSAGRLVRCNLSWLLAGQPTGDGTPPTA